MDRERAGPGSGRSRYREDQLGSPPFTGAARGTPKPLR